MDVNGFELKDMGVKELVKNYASMGFQAAHISDAVSLIKKMKHEKATIFLSFTSNMVSSGLREIFADMAKKKMIDAIITSAGSIEEDVMKSLGKFHMGEFNADDKELHEKGINRIGNIFVSDEVYEKLEDFLMPFFKEMLEMQNKKSKMISPSEMAYELGKRVVDEKSILHWASKNNIPVFCPAITDGALGMQLYFFKQKNKDFGIDVTADMDKLAKMVLEADKTAAIILGGGVAKHHTIGANLLREGLDYAVYVTTAPEYDGSLSGAMPKEAKSWSKIKAEKKGGKDNSVCVVGDATIIFPLIMLGVTDD